MARNKCNDCAHNIGIDTMDCEFACVGVTVIEDDGLVVVACEDYERRSEK